MNFEGLSEKLTGFNQYYESDLRERLEELEARRKIAQSHFTLASIAVVIIGIVIFAIMKDDVPFQAIFIVGGFNTCFFRSAGFHREKRSETKRSADNL